MLTPVPSLEIVLAAAGGLLALVLVGWALLVIEGDLRREHREGRIARTIAAIMEKPAPRSSSGPFR